MTTPTLVSQDKKPEKLGSIVSLIPYLKFHGKSIATIELKIRADFYLITCPEFEDEPH